MRLFRDTGIAGVGMVGSRGLQVIAQLAIAAAAGSAAFGRFSLAMAPVTWASLLTLLGLQHSIVRFESVESFDDGLATGLFDRAREALWFCVALGAAAATALVLLVPFLRVGAFADREMRTTLVIAALALPAMNGVTISAYSYRACRAFWQDTVVRNVSRGALFVAGVLIVLAAGKGRTAEPYAVAYTASFYLTLLIAVLRMPGRATLHGSMNRWRRGERLSFGLWVTGGVLAYEILLSTDRIVLSFFSSPEDLGRYAAAALVSRQMEMLGVVLYTVISPRVAASHNEGNARDHRSPDVGHALAIAGIVAVLGWLALSTLGAPVMGLIGSEYSDLGTILRILGGGYAALVVAAPLGAVIQFAGRERSDMILIASAAVVNLLLAPFLAAAAGAEGVAFSVAVAMGVLFIGRAVLVLRINRDKVG